MMFSSCSIPLIEWMREGLPRWCLFVVRPVTPPGPSPLEMLMEWNEWGSDAGQGRGGEGGTRSFYKGSLVLADYWRTTRALFFPMLIKPPFEDISVMSSMHISSLLLYLSFLWAVYFVEILMCPLWHSRSFQTFSWIIVVNCSVCCSFFGGVHPMGSLLIASVGDMQVCGLCWRRRQASCIWLKVC